MRPRITEAEWLKATTPIGLDLYRSAWQCYRKWRLFGAACCRRAILLTPDYRLDELAGVAERWADGLLNWTKVKEVRKLLPLVRRNSAPHSVRMRPSTTLWTRWTLPRARSL
jgi:hypothetical protein